MSQINRSAQLPMGERKTEQWVQFTSFKTRISISQELFQETWIPLGKALHARGIVSVALSQKVNSEDELNDFSFISKTWWKALKAIRCSFSRGLQAASTSTAGGIICTTQVGCFRVHSMKRADEKLAVNRHETIVEDEIKVYVMTTQAILSEEVMNKAETLCLVTGFQSYCVYELDLSAFPEERTGFYSWIIEVYIQNFFKDSVLEEMHLSGQFKDWKVVVHQDVVKFSV